MERVQGAEHLGAWRAKALRLQSCAGLLVKAFFPQADGHGFPLVCCGGRPPQCPKSGAGVPQAEALAGLPSLQAVQGEGGSSFVVTTAPAWWSTEDALRKHEELPPSPFIVGMGNLGQGSGQNLAPGVAGDRWDVPQDRCLGRLDGCQGG